MNQATRANLTKIKTKEYYNDGILEKKVCICRTLLRNPETFVSRLMMNKDISQYEI